jgi:hypothetical protein
MLSFNARPPFLPLVRTASIQSRVFVNPPLPIISFILYLFNTVLPFINLPRFYFNTLLLADPR